MILEYCTLFLQCTFLSIYSYSLMKLSFFTVYFVFWLNNHCQCFIPLPLIPVKTGSLFHSIIPPSVFFFLSFSWYLHHFDCVLDTKYYWNFSFEIFFL